MKDSIKIIDKINLKKKIDNRHLREIPQTRDIMGNFLDRVIARTAYLYKNK